MRPEEFTGRQQALEWFQAERQVLLAAIRQAADWEFGTHAWQLPWAVAMFLDWQGYWQELAATQLSALATARALGDLTWPGRPRPPVSWAVPRHCWAPGPRPARTCKLLSS